MSGIKLFYLFFEGAMLFQVIFFGMVYFISGRKDTLYYSLLNLFGATYFSVNAPGLFFGIDYHIVFNSPVYLYGNFAVILLLFLTYALFLKEIFKDSMDEHPVLKKLFRGTVIAVPVFYLVFVIFNSFGWNSNIIFYAAHLVNTPFVTLIFLLNFRKKGYKSLIINGMLVIFACTALTILFTIRYNAGYRYIIFDEYPLAIMRIGMLIDILIFQLALLRRWNENEKQLSVEKLQSQLAVEKLRNRISGELHDDIGSTLSGVSMYSHMATNALDKGDFEKVNNSLLVIRQSVTNIVENLKGLVWAVQPHQHSFEILMEKLIEFGHNICEAMQIKFNFPSNITSANFKLTEEQSYEIYLCLKEAINNAAKYSKGKSINLGYKFSYNIVELSVNDDGVGFDPAFIKEGNGLNNMRKRATNIGAAFEIISAKENGTTVIIKINSLPFTSRLSGKVIS